FTNRAILIGREKLPDSNLDYSRPWPPDRFNALISNSGQLSSTSRTCLLTRRAVGPRMTERGQAPHLSGRLTGCERSRISEPGLQLGREAPPYLTRTRNRFREKGRWPDATSAPIRRFLTLHDEIICGIAGSR